MYIRTKINLHQISIENFLRMSQKKRFNRLSEIKEICTQQVGQVHKVSSIKDIFNIPDGEIVNVSGTVTSITPVRPVTTGLLQEVTITDISGSISMSVWGNNTDKLELVQSYSFEKLVTRSFRDEKSLTLGHKSTYQTLETCTEAPLEQVLMKSRNSKML